MYILCSINETPMKICKFNGILIDTGCYKSGNYLERKFPRIQQSVWSLAWMKNAFERKSSFNETFSEISYKVWFHNLIPKFRSFKVKHDKL